ncbi:MULTISPECIES: hypothetical protein [Jannaschia]|uniref:hypothetical protein n=1 Tax=Jannaschia TaxID=188905 RepID=UPI001C7DB79D|nr:MULTISPECIES: hypothetical protein [unclassified Jannaschia]
MRSYASALVWIAVVNVGTAIGAEEITTEPLYLSGAGEVCGSEPRSCRHGACGRDGGIAAATVSCAIPTPASEDACTSTSPVAAIRRKLSEVSIAPSDNFREVFISSPGGRCAWRREEVFPTIMGLPDQDGFNCVGNFSDSGCDGGLQVAQEPTIYTYCEVSFGVYSACPSAQACGSDFLNCNSIVFGLNRDAMLELSPSVPNERILRNLLGAISSNFSTGLLTASEAHELSGDAEAAFLDVDALSSLLRVEQNREQ